MDKDFDSIFTGFSKKQEELIPILQKIQNTMGFLSEDAMFKVAGFLQIPESEVYSVATFYAQFRFEPIGENLIKVCHGTACYVQNAQIITEALENELDIKDRETTKDALFTLESVACLGCCSLAPVMMIGDNTHGKLSPAGIPEILSQYFKKGGKK